MKYMFTNRAKALGIILIAVGAVGALSYSQYTTDKQVSGLLQQKPVTITKVVEVTPTIAPTATPAAGLKFAPVTKIGTAAKATNIPAKGAVK